MNVLVPFDGSENSMRAVQYALNVAKKHSNISVTLLAVACPKFEYLRSEVFDPVAFQETCKDAYRKDMEVARKLFNDAGLEVEEVILTGDPADTIVDFAHERKFDKIIMGSRGMGALKSLVLGSVAYKVLGKVNIPVTIIK